MQSGVRSCAAIAAVAVFASACASPAPRAAGPAQGPQGWFALPIAMVFTSMDEDRDSRVSAAELARGITSAWSAADRDGDGFASGFEFEAWSIRMLGDADASPARVAFDVNFDGNVSAQEFEGRLGDEFGRLDRNRDGFLDRSELVVQVSGQPRIAGGGNRPGGDPPDDGVDRLPPR